jgi:aspartate/methionine/tyrosine aminotransferase
VTHYADRLRDIEPFQVMDVLARARALEAQGRSIVHMEIGEPDFPTTERIVQAGVAALSAGRTHYLPALGLEALRTAIAASYPGAARPESSRVVVTPGASGALQRRASSIRDRVLVTDRYPCNHFVRLTGRPIAIQSAPIRAINRPPT